MDAGAHPVPRARIGFQLRPNELGAAALFSPGWSGDCDEVPARSRDLDHDGQAAVAGPRRLIAIGGRLAEAETPRCLVGRGPKSRGREARQGAAAVRRYPERPGHEPVFIRAALRMVMENAALTPRSGDWTELVEAFRAQAWQECLDRLRPEVDADPSDLARRGLLADVAIRAGNPGLALLHYEKLLPLAVGQWDLFRAIAAQKGLDRVSPRGSHHAQRYRAIHEWFSSLGPPRRRIRASHGPRLAAASLLTIGADAFDALMAGCELESLGLAPCDEPQLEAVRVMIFGRVRVISEARGLEWIAEEGDTIAAMSLGEPPVAYRIEPELPAEALRFAGTPALPPLIAVEPAPRRAPRPAEPAVERAPAARAPRPVPDPVAEPWLAAGAPLERRRETRVRIALGQRIALLGLAGTRIKPIEGELVDLSMGGMCLGFPHHQVSQLKGPLENSVLAFRLDLPSGPPILASARVAWVRQPDSADPLVRDSVRVGFEFMPMPLEDRERLRIALRSVARTQTPGSPAREPQG